VHRLFLLVGQRVFYYVLFVIGKEDGVRTEQGSGYALFVRLAAVLMLVHFPDVYVAAVAACAVANDCPCSSAYLGGAATVPTCTPLG
jgi:hypothetical protein